MEPTSSEWRLVTKLSTYWYEHPLACDTAEGIRRWWLADGPDVPNDVVAAALAWMVTWNLVAASTAADGRIRFRRRVDLDIAKLRRLAGIHPDASEPDES
ncbi:hypothetical protein IV454_24115 [Massilia antarctica]|uniref:Uncharacterized protein n=1 Tax=Massilia antarctica TaxID=2765360 RepID=A0AA49A6W8_9BURK|nr:hypothetical protein [Massilia antarctica]QPI48586.1 hypothetical protein IV454_24115 [Massilia antarctica]